MMLVEFPVMVDLYTPVGAARNDSLYVAACEIRARTGASPLVLPRSRTHAALPETSSGGDAVRPHPVTRNGSRRAYSHRSFEGGLADRCRSASGCGFEPRLSGIRRK